MGRWLFNIALHVAVTVALLSLIVATWSTWSRPLSVAAAAMPDSFSSALSDVVEMAQAGRRAAAAIRHDELAVAGQDGDVQETLSNIAQSDYHGPMGLYCHW